MSALPIDAVRFMSAGGLHRWLAHSVQTGDTATADRISAELARRAEAGIFAAERRPCRYCPIRNLKQQHEAEWRGVCRQCRKALEREIRCGLATDGELVACGLLEEQP